jgi:hypothetical protein
MAASCKQCDATRQAFAEEVERRNGDNNCIAAVEGFLAECRSTSLELMTTDYVRRKLEDALALSASTVVASVKY